jgi:uncharacterized protein with ATP-grasp and redox domains
VDADESQLQQVIKQALLILQHMPTHATPPEIAFQMQQVIRKLVSNQDPFCEVKKLSTQQALAMYPEMKKQVSQSVDPLSTAIRLSIAGNIIDFGVDDEIADLQETVDRVLIQDYAIDDHAAFVDSLKSADHLLYLADNAGETVFDRILIEELSLPVIYAVKDSPILNDAILQDALDAGLDSCATIISTGSQAQGTILSICSAEFLEQFDRAPIILAKGQANYETLSNVKGNIFNLLQVKCPILGTNLGVPQGSIVFRQNDQP